MGESGISTEIFSNNYRAHRCLKKPHKTYSNFFFQMMFAKFANLPKAYVMVKWLWKESVNVHFFNFYN